MVYSSGVKGVKGDEESSYPSSVPEPFPGSPLSDVSFLTERCHKTCLVSTRGHLSRPPVVEEGS